MIIANHFLLCFPEKLRPPGSKFDEFGWSVESETFPIFAKLLNLPIYSEKVLLGLLISVGGVTERLVRQSSISVFKELESMNSGQLTEFGQMLIKIFKVSTLEFLINVALRLLIFGIFSRGYDLIREGYAYCL